MPRATIGISLRIRGVGEGRVHFASFLRQRDPVDHGADEGMPKLHPRTELDQVGLDRGHRSFGFDAHPRGGSPQQGRITNGLGRRNEQESPGLWRKGFDPLTEVLFDTARQTHGGGKPEPTGELLRRQSARQLQQCQRIALRLGDDPIPYAAVQWRGQSGIQQRSRI